MQMTVGIAIFTYQASPFIERCLKPWLESSLKPEILVIDSSSSDDTVKIAKELGAKTFVIPASHFNHGETRELARQMLQTDIIVMCTQDAFALTSNTLEELIEPLVSKKASLSYARQIPRDKAGIIESFNRMFNYPEKSELRGLDSIGKYGIHTFFCSNSCAAYLNSALNEIGGFKPTLLGEDTIACAKLLMKGHKVCYVAEALVEHSHNYSARQEFRRYFDIGFMRNKERNLFEILGKESNRGKVFAKQLLKQVWKNDCTKLFHAIQHLGAKWLGFHIGKFSKYAPLWFKQKCSSHPRYWKSLVSRFD